jgi:Rieske Fe-S protein
MASEKSIPEDGETTGSTYELNRRDVVVTGAAAIVTAAVAGQAGASEEPPELLSVQPGDLFQLISGEMKGELLKPDMLVEGERPIEAFPYDANNQVLRRKNRLNRLLLVRLDSAEMDEETSARQIEGVLAFSAICTHKGCTVNSWKPEERRLRCHCHLSEFDALSGGSAVSGPARRKLAMVPLALNEDGFVVATEGFTSEVGGARK